jgi:signal peptidase I
MAALAVFAGSLPTVAAAAADRGRASDIPVVVPVEMGRETRRSQIEAPRSKLPPQAALAAAMAVAAQVPGATVCTVQPTGSMRPMFNERAFLVSEPVKYDELQVGDIVTYWHPARNVSIVHRILEKKSGGFWTKGDYNDRPDDIYLTPRSHVRRVFAIIYAREGNTVPGVASAAAEG